MADDLLKNDGQKFLEMMEQLAERRMQREEEGAVDVEDDSEEDDEEGDEDEEDEDEEDEEDEEEEVRFLVTGHTTPLSPIAGDDGRTEDGGRETHVLYFRCAYV